MVDDLWRGAWAAVRVRVSGAVAGHRTLFSLTAGDLITLRWQTACWQPGRAPTPGASASVLPDHSSLHSAPLKSWSNAGKTRYTLFSYPDPARWPFGAKTVFDHLGVPSLTYNWNTNDFASVFLGERRVVMSFRSTGA